MKQTQVAEIASTPTPVKLYTRQLSPHPARTKLLAGNRHWPCNQLRTAHCFGAQPPPPPPASAGRLMTLRDPRAPAMGHRILQLGGGTPGVDAERAAEDAYTIRRYLQGVPEGQDELLREHALPLESNMEHMHGVDFHKGCYVGQELTIRTKHRGVVRKRVLPCMVYDVDRPEPQALAYDPEGVSVDGAAAAVPGETSIGRFEKRGRSAGKWLKGVGNIGMGLCRLEIMTDVVLPGEQAAATYKAGDEFVLEWGGEEDVKSGVKVKAFVPDWLRASMEEGQTK
ncbi:hypothetical protein PWT90_06307 [Aphanocladium album]|nr:hypothetical protein PWT90_06307 [Aphanocladium album]